MNGVKKNQRNFRQSCGILLFIISARFMGKSKHNIYIPMLTFAIHCHIFARAIFELGADIVWITTGRLKKGELRAMGWIKNIRFIHVRISFSRTIVQSLRWIPSDFGSAHHFILWGIFFMKRQFEKPLFMATQARSSSISNSRSAVLSL